MVELIDGVLRHTCWIGEAAAADLARLVALAAIWGASFMFMRMGARELGACALEARARVGFGCGHGANMPTSRY